MTVDGPPVPGGGPTGPARCLVPGRRVHVVGIGGAGMSAIARVLLERGMVVSGSDLSENRLTSDLVARGALVYVGHRKDWLGDAQVVVASSAIPTDNPELVAARARGLPVLKRDQALGELMAGSTGVAVSGSHGKTTTTGMIAHTLVTAGLDPTVVAGGVLANLGSNARPGAGPHFVVEADEYDHMFLGLRPRVAVVTNIEHDHPDIFPTPAAYAEAFGRFASLLPADGLLVACHDDAGVRDLLAGLNRVCFRVATYGLADDISCGVAASRVVAVERSHGATGGRFAIVADGRRWGPVELRVPGAHNVANALAVWVVARHLGVAADCVIRALGEFRGMGRRFEVVGVRSGVTVVDDYAHHPTEIEATLAAARERFGSARVWAVWQPHTFSRTELLRDRFARSFGAADRVVVLDVYRSREQPEGRRGAAAVVAAMDHPSAVHIPGRRAAAEHILAEVGSGDVVVTLGAGDGDAVGRWVLEGLEQRAGAADSDSDRDSGS